MKEQERKAKVKRYSTISTATAHFMAEEILVARNSHFGQIRSRHYGFHDAPKTHGIGADYAVPLWTVAMKELHQGKSIEDEESIKKQSEKRSYLIQHC